MDSMEESYNKDQADARKFRALREAIKAYTDDPPNRNTPAIERMTTELSDTLKAREDHIVAVWN